MRVEIHVLFPFRAEIGGGPLALDIPREADIMTVVAVLVEQHPPLRRRIYGPNGRIGRHISALVNGASVQFKQGFATRLCEGDVVTLLPPLGGG